MKIKHESYRDIFGDSLELVASIPARAKKDGTAKKARHFLKAPGLAIAINSPAMLEKVRKLAGVVSVKSEETKPEKVAEVKKQDAEKKPEKVAEKSESNDSKKWWEEL